MNINISGTGTVSAGDYDAVRISGRGLSGGLVRCKSFLCSGSFSGESDIECEGKVQVSGSFKNTGTLKAGTVNTSGSCKNSGNISADNIKCSGILKTDSDIKATELSSSGKVEAKGDIEAENLRVSGAVICGGLLNAENLQVDMASNSDSKATSVGGSRITVRRQHWAGGLFYNTAKFVVEESVEGDEIDLKHTYAKTVSGRRVTIGKGCKIELVQYTENVDIARSAKVGKCEKI